MTDQTPIPISSLPAATVLTGAELFPVVQGGVTKKALLSLVTPGAGGTGIPGPFFDKTTIITATQMLNDLENGIEIVPTQGADKFIFPVFIVAIFRFVNSTFDGIADTWFAKYQGTSTTFGSLLDADTVLALPYSRNNSDLFVNITDAGLVDTSDKALLLVANDNPVVNGSILSSIVKNAGGTGWAAGNTFDITGGDANATGIVDTVSAGAIATCHLINAGTGYTAASGVAITATSGVGIGATVNTSTPAAASYLEIITYYAVLPTDDVNRGPTNSQFLISNGIESYIRNCPKTVLGTSFPPGNVAFATSGLTFNEWHYKQNPNNPAIISKVSNRFTINYPCIVLASVGIIGVALQTPFSAECVLTHAADGNEWGDSQSFSGAVGVLTQPPVNFAATSGPVFVNSGDVWDGNVNIDAVGPTGNVLRIQQANFAIYILQVIGKIQTFNITSIGNGYAVGDTVQIDDGYVPAQVTVAAVNGSGGVTSLTFASLDARGLGYYLSTLYTTTNIDPQIGVGTGLTVTVTTIYQ